ncbi:hypothetical protein RZS28_03855 [Methylocapsa polymorpha]|uniref:LysM domain-containing protein n=1 Tax=Methylocapsa polymorpha TaxID=3080828 RepID=A0ABZ0HUE0_9HYPH|nr:hypothetical protein RZS28_03855 [Methylocapsa sp. RX1]
MFDHTSRYYTIPTATIVLPDGREIAFARRRFLPRSDRLPLLAEAAVTPGDRIDLLANRVYGDPLAFWRICDANDVIDPQDMMRDAASNPAVRLRVPTPQA